LTIAKWKLIAFFRINGVQSFCDKGVWFADLFAAAGYSLFYSVFIIEININIEIFEGLMSINFYFDNLLIDFWIGHNRSFDKSFLFAFVRRTYNRRRNFDECRRPASAGQAVAGV
jgi:hypothetical protein